MPPRARAPTSICRAGSIFERLQPTVAVCDAQVHDPGPAPFIVPFCVCEYNSCARRA